jgi:hypothetical protein
MRIENGSDNSATGPFYIPSDSHIDSTKIPVERNTTRGRKITQQRNGLTGNIPASDFQIPSEQPFAREPSLSRGTSHFTDFTVG